MSMRREWTIVVAIALAAALAASIFALQLVQYVIMPDELGYLKQGIQLSHGILPRPNQMWFNSWALLRPLTIAPAYKVFATPTAFDVAHVIGAVLMASTAIPAYLFARRVTGHGLASLLVAAQSVFIPWLCMAGSMMSEVVAYPAFVWAVLAMLNAVERPRVRNDLLFAAALAVAFFARTQLVILGPVFLVAVVVHALVRVVPGRGAAVRVVDAVRAHWLVIAAAAIALIGVLATGSSQRFLGGYAESAHGSLFPPGSAHAMHELSGYVVVGIGVVPLAFAIAWAGLAIARRGAGAAGAIVITLTTAALVIVGGAFTVRYTAGINDRYLFYAVPLLFTGMAAAFLEERRGLAWRVAGAAGGIVAVWLVWTSQLAQHGPSLVSPTMSFHDVLSARGHDVGLSGPHLAAVVGGIVVLLALILAPRLRAVVALAIVSGLVLVFCFGETINTFDSLAATQSGAGAQFLAGRNWVDKIVPNTERVGAVLAPVGDPTETAATWWDTTFWNKTLDSIYRAGETPLYEQGFSTPATADPDTGEIPGLDPSPFLVRSGSDTRFGLHISETIGSHGGLELIKAARPYRADWLFTGPDPETATVPAGASGTVRVFGTPGKRPVELTLGVPAGSGPARVAIDTEGALGTSGSDLVLRAASRTTQRLRLTLLPGSDKAIGHADITIRVGDHSAPVKMLAALAG